MRIEHTTNGLLIKFANHLTLCGTPTKISIINDKCIMKETFFKAM